MDEVTKVRIEGVDYALTDEATRTKVNTLTTKVSTIQNLSDANTADVTSLKSAVTKIQTKETETDATLTDHDGRITKAQNTADSNTTKYSALSAVIDDNTQKIADEVERAKAVEGERDQLTATSKDTLVAAINWVQTRAEKALENVGTLTDLTTDEKTDVVSAINELTKRVAALETAASSTAAE